jgi:hypothetical protein
MIALEVTFSVCDVIAVLTIKSVFAIPVRPLPLPTKETAVITPTLRLDGGEILVENPARPDALDILCYFLVIYQDSIAVNIVLNVVELVNAG